MPLYAPPTNVELVPPAEIQSNVLTTSTTLVDITGLTITLVAPNNPFYVRFHFPQASTGSAGGSVTFALVDGAGTTLDICVMTSAASNAKQNGTCEAHLPRDNYAITPGTSYTFKMQWLTSAGTATLNASSTARPRLSAISC